LGVAPYHFLKNSFMSFVKKEKKVIWPYILIIFLIIFLGLLYWGYVFVKNLTPEKILQSNIVKQELGQEKTDFYLSLARFLGFDNPKTYLILFQNNTELRPGGGFIGVYAILKVNKGHLEIITIDGTENLDRNAPVEWKSVPPEIISKHLKVDRWYFRDSNWSPDFSESAKKALEFYKAEGGVEAENINVVIAFTPTVLEKLLEITGSFVVNGIEFKAENVIEKLEYEVEYGYAKSGIAFTDRKKIIRPFMNVLLEHLQMNLFDNLHNYENFFKEMIKQKQIVFYSTEADWQKNIEDNKWDGKLDNNYSDYLLWVDANLASLKTDHAIKRELKYSIRPQDDRYIATVEMIYNHKGVFDWRTSRYRTYARIFVPIGSEWISTKGAMNWDRTEEAGTTDIGVELNRQWFGAFISIEPGKKDSLIFEYYLPKEIKEQIDKGQYDLSIQKQLGTIDHTLTLDLDFAKNIIKAVPAENSDDWGDNFYKIKTDLTVDRYFVVNF